MTDVVTRDAGHEAEVRRWRATGDGLTVGTGVHRPSPFSAALAAVLPDLSGRAVVDAGCGAGLVSIAALTRGASRVVALDRQPQALTDTVGNVARVLGDEARSRLEVVLGDWDALAPDGAAGTDVDITVVNPPQRPAAVLARSAPQDRHLHEGAGPDGLAALRALLEVTGTPEVITTASSLLGVTAANLPHGPFTRAELLREVPVLHAPAWSDTGTAVTAAVGIWRLSR
jgi:methylase of polypeptide subunit release factors